MNREDQRKITKNLIALRKTMQKDVETIADRLCSAGVLTKNARNEIATVRPNIAQLKCGVLINKLLRSGPGSYGKFTKILEDMGYFEMVESMEKTLSVSPVPDVNDNRWQEEREKTFVIKNPTISERLQVPPTKKQSNTKSGPCKGHNDKQIIEEVQQLERMMTFVMTSIDQDDKNKNKTDLKHDIKQRLLEESKGDEQLMGFFKTLRYNRFSLRSQSMAH